VEKIIIKKEIDRALSSPHSTPSSQRKLGSRQAEQDPGFRWDDGVKVVILFFLLFLFFQTTSYAFDKPIEKNYFASLRSNETNVRAGPGSQYPIKFTFKLRGIPIKVISEYDNWNEIKDYEGDTGWVSQNLTTKKRTVLVKTNKSFVNLYAKPSAKSKVVLRLENDVAGDFIKCGLEYCGIKVVGKKGWISKKEIWGVDENDVSK
jgi:SH3-like domain-containing protein